RANWQATAREEKATTHTAPDKAREEERRKQPAKAAPAFKAEKRTFETKGKQPI
ncbi:MAG: hypothetical protein HQK65_09925, partial [Desulfamplus sp.]|nr:hypothetical protein [Desulfamplus sp.]